MKKIMLISVVVMMAAVLPTQASLLSQLEGQWSFEGPDKETWYADTSGNGVTLTVNSNVSIRDPATGDLYEGYSGQAMGYKRTAPLKKACYMKAVSGGNFHRDSQLDPFAVELWFKPLSTAINGDLISYGEKSAAWPYEDLPDRFER